MLFASTELAARIERAESRLMADCASVVARAPDRDAFAIPLAGGFATLAGPESPLNKVAGLGFEGPLDEAALEAVEGQYADRKVPVQVELSILAEPSIGVLLTRRGYRLVGFENVLGLGLPVAPGSEAAAGVEIQPSGDDDLPLWLDIVVAGFAAPDTQGLESHESFPREALEQSVRDITSAPGFARYLARLDGAPAGAGSMRTFESVAQLCGAATLPEHRRRGVQTTLLARRLADAEAAGCDIAVVTTQPGSKSHQNVQRRGFELLYTRAVLVREW